MKIKILNIICLIISCLLTKSYAANYYKYCDKLGLQYEATFCQVIVDGLNKYKICSGDISRWEDMVAYYSYATRFTTPDKNEYYNMYFKSGTFDNYYQKHKCIQTTSDGKCGSKNGKNCHTNYCCSKYGYCGNTKDYCGKNCDPRYGLCW